MLLNIMENIFYDYMQLVKRITIQEILNIVFTVLFVTARITYNIREVCSGKLDLDNLK